VVICLANPRYEEGSDASKLNQLIISLRSGEEALPSEFDYYYQRITKPIGVPLERLRTQVAVFNVCPYASINMTTQREIERLTGISRHTIRAYHKQFVARATTADSESSGEPVQTAPPWPPAPVAGGVVALVTSLSVCNQALLSA
jgi:hypothetical protein